MADLLVAVFWIKLWRRCSTGARSSIQLISVSKVTVDSTASAESGFQRPLLFRRDIPCLKLHRDLAPLAEHLEQYAHPFCAGQPGIENRFIACERTRMN